MVSWPPGVTKPTRMSLAQFSKNLAATDSQGRRDCVGAIAEEVGKECVGHQLFAADVVAATAYSPVKSNKEELQHPQLTGAKSKGRL
jgi:hypothetical protein